MTVFAIEKMTEGHEPFYSVVALYSDEPQAREVWGRSFEYVQPRRALGMMKYRLVEYAVDAVERFDPRSWPDGAPELLVHAEWPDSF